MARPLLQMKSLSYSNNFFARYPPALIVIYVLTGYICIISLYTLILGIVFRFEQGRFFFPGDTADPFYELGTSFGFWGTLYFCLNFILATRWRWVESLFDGLDRVYQTHQLVGKLTLTFVVLHGVILAFQALPDIVLLSTYFVPGIDISYTFGFIGLLLLTMLVIVTIWIKLPYQLWLQSHKFMGIAYVLGGLHAIILQLDWYMIMLTLIGGYAWLYNLVLYKRVAPKSEGHLVRYTQKYSINELVIGLQRPFHAQPGQFVFISITQSAQNLPSELHPFSLSGIIDNQTIRVSAKALGDYTAALSQLQIGDSITVYGPYGMFGAKYLQTRQPMIWVAGGIGITPFLSMLQFESTRKDAPSQPICFIWTVTEEQDAVYLDEITTLQQCIPHLEFHLHISSIKGRLTSKTLQELLGDVRLRESVIFMCGSIPMMRSLTNQITAHGVTRGKIVTEEFALR